MKCSPCIGHELETLKDMGRVLVIGDIHGNHKALLQCLERSNFNREVDTLVTLGDIVDGHSDSFECVETLLSIPKRIDIKGNHDDWFLEYITYGVHGSNWEQGAKATLASYVKNNNGIIPETHQHFFRNQVSYHLTDDNILFVHGGFNRHEWINKQTYGHIYYWDRDLWSQALSYKSMIKQKSGFSTSFKMKGDFKKIFIGHTSTMFWDSPTPMKAANIINLDTDAGWFGKLSIMDAETEEFWQSDPASELYPEYTGRK